MTWGAIVKFLTPRQTLPHIEGMESSTKAAAATPEVGDVAEQHSPRAKMIFDFLQLKRGGDLKNGNRKCI